MNLKPIFNLVPAKYRPWAAAAAFIAVILGFQFTGVFGEDDLDLEAPPDLNLGPFEWDGHSVEFTSSYDIENEIIEYCVKVDGSTVCHEFNLAEEEEEAEVEEEAADEAEMEEPAEEVSPPPEVIPAPEALAPEPPNEGSGTP